MNQNLIKPFYTTNDQTFFFKMCEMQLHVVCTTYIVTQHLKIDKYSCAVKKKTNNSNRKV